MLNFKSATINIHVKAVIHYDFLTTAICHFHILFSVPLKTERLSIQNLHTNVNSNASVFKRKRHILLNLKVRLISPIPQNPTTCNVKWNFEEVYPFVVLVIQYPA